MERWTRIIDIEGEQYEVSFERRPFREGVQARVRVGDETIQTAELGLGEEALLLRLRGEISALRSTRRGR